MVRFVLKLNLTYVFVVGLMESVEVVTGGYVLIEKSSVWRDSWFELTEKDSENEEGLEMGACLSPRSSLELRK